MKQTPLFNKPCNEQIKLKKNKTEDNDMKKIMNLLLKPTNVR